MRFGHTVRLAVIWTLVACAAQFVRADFDPTKQYRLEVSPPKLHRATLSMKVAAPRAGASEWVIVAPLPPERDAVALRDIRLLVKDKDIAGTEIAESSDLFRPVFVVRVPAKDAALRSGIDFRVEYDVRLRTRRLVEGPSTRSMTPLESRFRRFYLASTQTTDWSNPVFSKWLDESGLRRKPDESDMALAYRAFRAIVKDGQYEFPTSRRRPSEVCTTPKTDCGGFALLFTAVMRANNIPARTLWGRWAKPQEGDYGQYHVKAEFYADNVGWVPVEVTGAITWKGIDIDDCFGRENGDFITLHEDTDLLIDSIHFGTQPVAWHQGVLFWVKGVGDLKGMETQERWDVRAMPE